MTELEVETVMLYFEEIQVSAVEHGPEFAADTSAMMEYAAANDP